MTIRWSPAGILAVLFISVVTIYLVRETILPALPSFPFSGSSESSINLRSLLCVSILAAQRGGQEVKRIHDAELLNTKNKGNTATRNPVTDGDLRSHHVMMTTLTTAFPSLKVISEEHDPSTDFHNVYVGPVDPNSCPSDVTLIVPGDLTVRLEDLQLWIDPLDATQEYTENLLNYVTTMVGIAVKGHAVAGVIHKPFATDESEGTFWAWKDHGVSANLRSSSNGNDSLLKIIVSRSHSGDVEEVARDAFAGRVMEVVPAGGAGFKTLEVIAGRASVYLHTTKIKKWDLCAPNGLLNAVGGRLTTLEGAEIDYRAPRKETDVVNTGGVVAAVVEHKHYLDVFARLRTGSRRAREDS